MTIAVWVTVILYLGQFTESYYQYLAIITLIVCEKHGNICHRLFLFCSVYPGPVR